ncbi:MAG: GAF domain-containing protein [Candidatus Hydrogenedens sp.]|nr:GAF domain-containing protein [Candidatus Hydrogenedens sp.]
MQGFSINTDIYLASVLLLISICSSLGLGAVVLHSNAGRRAHRVFAVLMLNLALWGMGVFCIIHCPTEAWAAFAIHATFIVACFLPANFLWFVSEFPRRRSAHLRTTLVVLYLAGIALAGLSFTSGYLKHVTISANQPPIAAYGPVFNAYPVLVLVAMGATLYDLLAKLRRARGIERRQVQYVLVGIFACTGAATATNVVAPVLGLTSTEIYGPCFVVIMAGFFTYAMVRYHLLDVWILFSRATVYGIVMVFVTVAFMGSVSLVHWISLSYSVQGSLLSSALASVLVVFLAQPLKERAQLVLDRLLLHRHYDAAMLIERVTRRSAALVQLDSVLDGAARELANAMGATRVWFLLADEDEEALLEESYSLPAERSLGLTLDERLALYRVLDASHQSCVPLDRDAHRGGTSEQLLVQPALRARRAVMLVPLRGGSGIAGALVLGEKDTHDMYDQDDVRVFRAVAGPLATAIENARLYERLEKLNIRLERIMGGMRAGVVAVDGAGKVTTVNGEAQVLLGPVRPGDPMERLDPKLSALLHETLEGRRGISDVESVITTPEDEKIPVAMSSSYLATGGDESVGAMVLIFNMTQIKLLESSVQRADRLTSIGTMAAGMAHEIKNPLQSIKTFTQLLQKRYDDPDFRKTFSEVVPPEVQRIDDIVTQLLDFARPKPTQFEPQNLHAIISDVLALVANQLSKADIDLVLRLPEESPPVKGDNHQLKQVFLNLFLNAIEAMQGRESRRLHVRVTYGFGRVGIAGRTDVVESPCVRVTVTDTGCGIPPADLPQLFNPFFTTKADGSGLGLSVVHKIVEEHGGEINVTSEQGVGTTFFVVLPLAGSTAPQEAVR